MSEEGWSVLRRFDSEGEARVVESFLKAKGFDVQLLGAHSHQTTAVRGFAAGVGMRLIVRENDVAAANQAMLEAENSGTPEFNVGTPPPSLWARRDYIAFILLGLLSLVVYFITKAG